MIDLGPLARVVNNQPVLVYGLGGSGLAAVRCLRHAHINVYAGDDDATKIEAATALGAQPLNIHDDSTMKNAAYVVVAPAVPLHFPKPHDIVRAARAHNIPVIGDIELFGLAQTGATTIGITGTNGKSTTTALVHHILQQAGKSTVMGGNIGTPILDLTVTPETTVVIEMSSFQLDLCPTFHPSISAHLNITPDHLDRHGTIENYIAAKERIFGGSGIGFCGIDDDESQGMFARARNNPNRQMIPVSVKQAINDGLCAPAGDLIDTVFSGGYVDTINNLPTLRGRHNHQNAIFAYGIARALSIDAAAIFKGLMTYPGLPHRQFMVRHLGLVEYINDSKATNADATDQALSTFQNIHWLVGGQPKAGGLSGLEHHGPRVKHAYLFGQATDDFAAFMRVNNIPYTPCQTMDTALKHAHTAAQNENMPATVLLSPACASYDQFKNYEERGQIYERLVNSLLKPDNS